MLKTEKNFKPRPPASNGFGRITLAPVQHNLLKCCLDFIELGWIHPRCRFRNILSHRHRSLSVYVSEICHIGSHGLVYAQRCAHQQFFLFVFIFHTYLISKLEQNDIYKSSASELVSRRAFNTVMARKKKGKKKHFFFFFFLINQS